MNLFSEVGFELSGKTEKYKTANTFLLAFGHNCCGFSTFKLDDTANLQSFLNNVLTFLKVGNGSSYHKSTFNQFTE